MAAEITVVVCTFNQADRLEDCLHHLAQQSLDFIRFNVLVVNNLCTDHTDTVVERCIDKEPRMSLRLLHEPNQGLAFARNLGLESCQTKYIAYIDDDSNASAEWLSGLLNALENNPNAVCVGGPIGAYFTTTIPGWFKNAYETRTWGEVSRTLERSECFSGSNMLWKTSVLKNLGGFPTTFGMKGTTLGLGEESFVFQKLWKTNPKAVVVYNPGALVSHWVPSRKMKLIYRLKRAYSLGKTSGLMTLETEGASASRTGRSMTMFVIITFRSLFSLWKYRCIQNWICEEATKIAQQLGRIMGGLRSK